MCRRPAPSRAARLRPGGDAFEHPAGKTDIPQVRNDFFHRAGLRAVRRHEQGRDVFRHGKIPGAAPTAPAEHGHDMRRASRRRRIWPAIRPSIQCSPFRPCGPRRTAAHGRSPGRAGCTGALPRPASSPLPPHARAVHSPSHPIGLPLRHPCGERFRFTHRGDTALNAPCRAGSAFGGVGRPVIRQNPTLRSSRRTLRRNTSPRRSLRTSASCV